MDEGLRDDDDAHFNSMQHLLSLTLYTLFDYDYLSDAITNILTDFTYKIYNV